MQPIGQVAVSGGEVEPVQIPMTQVVLDDISPDGSTFLVESYEQGQSQTRPLYAVPVLGGTRQYLANVTGAAWTPDGKSVAYTTPNGDIYLIRSDGTDSHKLISLGGPIDREVGKGEGRALAWSPDGSRISLTKNYLLWEMSSSGTDLHRIVPDGQLPPVQCCGRWSPDGKIFVFLSGTDEIWAIDEQHGLFQRPSPVLLAPGPIRWGNPQFSRDSKTIFANGSTSRGELVRLDKKSNQFQPFLAGISADLVSFSRDGQAVAYVSYPDSILWRANKDGGERLQLTDGALFPQSVSWSPDATEIVFMAPSGGQVKAYIVSSQGGSPRLILPDVDESEIDPNWSPDGSKIVFSTSSTIRILDLASHQVTPVPGSEGKSSAHWSPDGRFIDALSRDSSKLYLFDIKTQHWSTLYENQGAFAYPIWTRDSHFIYFIRPANGGAVLRIPVTGGDSQLVMDLKDFHYAGLFGLWLGLDPTDAPLMLHDLGTNDIYALSLEQE
jgi:Tol biopolymer transport system component